MKKNAGIIFAISAVIIITAFASVYKINEGKNHNYLAKNEEKSQIQQEILPEQIKNEPQGTLEPVKQPEGIPNNDTGMDKNQLGNNQNEGEKTDLRDTKVKAVYMTGSTAGSKKRLEHFIELVKNTELNAVVIDVKDDFGKVNYKSDIKEVNEIGAYHKLYDVNYVINRLHENNIYVIGRIVTFKDPLLPTKRADLAIKTPSGQIWREKGKTAWVNPYQEEVWTYNINIAKEAADKGFDEIQFDYVRYPAAPKKEVYFGDNVPTKADTICKFLDMAQNEIGNKKGIRVSADVFGIICESPGDFENIGQELEKVGRNIDYISPMVYPSHYANKAQNGSGQTINGINFPAPDLKPYEVVYNTLVKAKERISKVQGYKADVRPYLQDFTASWLKKGYYQTYGVEQVRQQIKAVYDAGYEEWIFWDPGNTYTEAAFLPEKGQ